MPRRSAAAILSVPMSKPRYTAVESQLMISPSKRSAIASASALLPVAVGPRTATALALFKVAHGHAAFVSTERSNRGKRGERRLVLRSVTLRFADHGPAKAGHYRNTDDGPAETGHYRSSSSAGRAAGRMTVA